MLERVIRETCIAGAVIDRCIKASFPRGGKRKKKDQMSSPKIFSVTEANLFSGKKQQEATQIDIRLPTTALKNIENPAISKFLWKRNTIEAISDTDVIKDITIKS